jgi:hypothetical protein
MLYVCRSCAESLLVADARISLLDPPYLLSDNVLNHVKDFTGGTCLKIRIQH